MKKKNWIIAGVGLLGTGVAAAALAIKVNRIREDKNKKNIYVLNDDLDQPLQAMEDQIENEAQPAGVAEESEEPILYQTVVDPLTRNEQIVREVARMEKEDNNEPLKSDDELGYEDQGHSIAIEDIPSDDENDKKDYKVVNDFLSVYTHLDTKTVLNAIERAEQLAQAYQGQSIQVNYYVHLADQETVDRFLNIMSEFGYHVCFGELENSVIVKTIVYVDYNKLLQDILTIDNQVHYLNGEISDVEVVA